MHHGLICVKKNGIFLERCTVLERLLTVMFGVETERQDLECEIFFSISLLVFS